MCHWGSKEAEIADLFHEGSLILVFLSFLFPELHLSTMANYKAALLWEPFLFDRCKYYSFQILCQCLHYKYCYTYINGKFQCQFCTSYNEICKSKEIFFISYNESLCWIIIPEDFVPASVTRWHCHIQSSLTAILWQYVWL